MLISLNLVITLKKAQLANPAVTINYGLFLNTIINFLIIALVIFLLVRPINRLKKKDELKLAGPAEDILLLREIQDSLKK